MIAEPAAAYVRESTRAGAPDAVVQSSASAMAREVIVRPIWRRFSARFLANAAAYVHEGGHAAIVSDRGIVDMLLTVDDRGKITEQGQWALLAIEQQRWRRVTSGVALGLAAARASRKFAAVVIDWCERDGGHPGPTRKITFDCTTCAACCHDANVVLSEADLARWRSADLLDLLGRTYVRRDSDGKITLRFAESGRCQHLREDKRCGIYAVRPDNCRVFPAGSEACLAAREDTLGLRDD